MQAPRVTLLDSRPKRFWERVKEVITKVTQAAVAAVVIGTIVAVVVAVCWKIVSTVFAWAF